MNTTTTSDTPLQITSESSRFARGVTISGKKIAYWDKLVDPMKWRKSRHVVVGDIFHERVPFEFIDRVFAVMALCPQHTFQVLTKRPERMAEYLTEREDGGLKLAASVRDIVGRSRGDEWVSRTEEAVRRYDNARGVLPNVWLGTSVENQKAADERIPHLLQCPAAVRFLSCEPLLGEVDLAEWLPPINWVHPEPGDDGMAAMACIGVKVGEEFLHAWCAGWDMPPDITSRRSGDGLWSRGKVRVRRFTRSRLLGPHVPQYGDADRGCVQVECGSMNVVCGQLYVSNIVGDPYLKFPIAKAPAHGIHWVIVGGESGPKSRPCDVEWIESIVRQCREAGVATFVKQLGTRPMLGDVGDPHGWPERDGPVDWETGRIRLFDSKGGDPAEWPEHLRVRQFPEVKP